MSLLEHELSALLKREEVFREALDWLFRAVGHLAPGERLTEVEDRDLYEAFCHAGRVLATYTVRRDH